MNEIRELGGMVLTVREILSPAGARMYARFAVFEATLACNEFVG